jgi:hypothetical protein
MNYKDYLKIAEGKDFYPYKLVAAVEVNFFVEEFELEYDEDDFEKMCELVYEYYIEQDEEFATLRAIAYELKEILFEDRLYNVKDIEMYWCDIKEEIRRNIG